MSLDRAASLEKAEAHRKLLTFVALVEEIDTLSRNAVEIPNSKILDPNAKPLIPIARHDCAESHSLQPLRSHEIRLANSFPENPTSKTASIGSNPDIVNQRSIIKSGSVMGEYASAGWA